MDIYQFIDSKDIRNYLKDMRYKFTVPETAFLIYMCRRATLNEKFDAWQGIIDTMPDCSMGERLNMEEISSFQRFLTEYILMRFMRKRETGPDLSGNLDGWKKEIFFWIFRWQCLT